MVRGWGLYAKSTEKPSKGFKQGSDLLACDPCHVIKVISTAEWRKDCRDLSLAGLKPEL